MTDPDPMVCQACSKFHCRACHQGYPGCQCDGVLESRVPADLNPWSGVAIVALHNHTETDPCDDTCTEY